MRRLLLIVFCVALLGGSSASLTSSAQAPELEGMTVPQYTAEGDLIRPEGYRTWVFVGASLGLSYREEAGAVQEGPGDFHNVYIQPEAYRYYMETGIFPEKTILAMETYRPGSRESINQAGYFEKQFASLAVALKDHERYEEGWAYVSFRQRGGGLKSSSSAFPKQTCYSCHEEHAATDNVFTQFYPILQR